MTLQLRDAPTKMVFEVLSRQTGINFILDKDVKSDGKTTIFVQDVPVEEAIDLVLDQNSLARQILASNMVLIYPNNAGQAEGLRGGDRTHLLSDQCRRPRMWRACSRPCSAPRRCTSTSAPRGGDARHAGCGAHGGKARGVDRRARAEVMLEVEVLEITQQQAVRTWASPIRATPLSDVDPTAVRRIGGAAGDLVLSDLRKQNSQHHHGLAARRHARPP